MTEHDVNFIIRYLEKLEKAVKSTAEETQKQINPLVTDIAVIKSTMDDIKKEVFGNGKEGLTVRTTKLEARVTGIEGIQDKAITTDEVLQARFRKMEEKILKWSGLVLGVNLTIGAIITWIVNWEKITKLLNIGGH